MGKNKFILMAVITAMAFGCAVKEAPTSKDKQVNGGASAMDMQLDELARQIMVSLTQQNTKRLAVIEFTDLEGRSTTFGKFVAEELTTRLFATKRFQIVERQLIDKILNEQSLGMTGAVDQATMQRVGEVLGVEAIATGSVAQTEDAVKINARIIATGTGSVFAAAAVSLPRDARMSSAGDGIGRTGTVYLSDMEPTFANVGWGKFERDVFRERFKIRLNYRDLEKGLNTHAPARVSYALNRTYSKFESLIGLWDSGNSGRGVPGDMCRTNGSVTFKVFLDGTEAYTSGVLTWNMTKKVSISVKGAKTMDLIVEDAGDGYNCDWSVWGDAKLIS